MHLILLRQIPIREDQSGMTYRMQDSQQLNLMVLESQDAEAVSVFVHRKPSQLCRFGSSLCLS